MNLPNKRTFFREINFGNYFAKKGGFTFIEMIVVIGIAAVLVGIGMPFYVNSTMKSNLLGTTENLKSTIYRQQQYAVSQKNNLSYGIYFETGKYTTFTGTSFLSGTNKEVIELAKGIEIQIISLSGGVSEVVFLSGNFKPKNYGALTLKANDKTTLIDINSEGAISKVIP
jgi:prepilin-type N-terminal cleavage/methylation domain-containing protein